MLYTNCHRRSSRYILNRKNINSVLTQTCEHRVTQRVYHSLLKELKGFPNSIVLMIDGRHKMGLEMEEDLSSTWNYWRVPHRNNDP
jgi:hypothetical protein